MNLDRVLETGNRTTYSWAYRHRDIIKFFLNLIFVDLMQMLLNTGCIIWLFSKAQTLIEIIIVINVTVILVATNYHIIMESRKKYKKVRK